METIHFIDRQEELERIEACINAWSESSLVFVNGKGGIGKTRLLQEVAQRHKLLQLSSAQETSGPSHSSGQQQPATIMAVQLYESDSFVREINNGLRSMCSEFGIDLSIHNCDFDLDKMAHTLEEIVKEQPDAIIVDHGQGNRVQLHLEHAVSQNIQVLTLASRLRVEGMATSMEMNDYELALLSLNRMVRDIEGAGDILVVTRPTYSQRNRQRVLDLITERYPAIGVVGRIGVNYPQYKDIDTTFDNITRDLRQALLDNPDIEAVWASWHLLANCASEVLVEMGLNHIPVYGTDITQKDVELIAREDYPWCVTTTVDPYEMGRVLVRLAMQAIRGEELKQYYSMPVALIDQDTVQDVSGTNLWELDVKGFGESFIGWKPWMMELRERFAAVAEARRLVIADIVDFDDDRFRVPHNIYLRLAGSIGIEAFEPYARALQDWRMVEQAGVSQELLDREMENAYSRFVECFNHVSEHQRILLSFDTAESISREAGQSLNSVLPRLSNYCLIVAGRDTSSISKHLDDKHCLRLDFLTLEPFDGSASREYLEEKQSQLLVNLDPNLVEKLIILSDGRPILLDLAVDWLSRNVPLKWLEEVSLDHLREKSAQEVEKYQEEFEQYLVNRFTQIRSTIDSVILTMSYVYPLDAQGLVELMDGFTLIEAQALIDEVMNYVTVKKLPDGTLKLHDEMQRLVNLFAWPEIDPYGERRRHLSVRAVRYLQGSLDTIYKQIVSFSGHCRTIEQQLETLESKLEKEQDKEKSVQLSLQAIALRRELVESFLQRESLERDYWSLAGQLLHHAVAARKTNYLTEAFVKLFDRALYANQLSYCQDFINVVAPLLEVLDTRQHFEVSTRIAKYYARIGQYQEAKSIVQRTLIYDDELLPIQKIEAWNQLANVRIRLGEFPSGIQTFERALQTVVDSNLEDSLPDAQTALGWSYRLAGRLDEAMKLYRTAWLAAIEKNNLDLQITLQRSMAYIYALNSRHQAAYQLGSESLKLAEDLHDRSRIAVTRASLINILLEVGRLREAMSLKRETLDELSALKQLDHLSRCLSTVGFVELLLGDLEHARRDLLKAENISPEGNKPNSLYRLGYLHRTLGNIDEANQLFRRGYRKSLEVFNPQLELYSLAGLAEVSLLKKDFQAALEFIEMLNSYEERWAEAQYYAPEGLCRKLIADLLTSNDEADMAIEYYESGLPLLVKYANYEPMMPVNQLQFTERILENFCLPRTMCRIGQELRSYWIQESLDEVSPIALSVFIRWSQGCSK